MTSPGAAETIPAPDLVLDLFGAQASIAATVLREHIDDSGLCAMCASAWPYERRCSPSRRFDMVAQADRTGDAGTPMPVAGPVTHAKFINSPVDVTLVLS